jgi:DNA uptake protein ComE-like DNA-binding protein
MDLRKRLSQMLLGVTAIAILAAGPARAQVGKSLGVADINTAPEANLVAIAGLTPAIVKGIVDKRPFASLTELNAYLLSQGLTQEQAMAVYQKAVVHVNLNTATREEIVLIPGAGTRMAREFAEYRPWKTWAQFDREISKYVGQEATDTLKQYVFIPINANSATDADLMTIPGLTPAVVAQLKQGRPYASKEQLEQQLAKASNAKDAARIGRFLVIQ